MKASTELELEAALAAYQQAWLDLVTVVPPLSGQERWVPLSRRPSSSARAQQAACIAL